MRIFKIYLFEFENFSTSRRANGTKARQAEGALETKDRSGHDDGGAGSLVEEVKRRA